MQFATAAELIEFLIKLGITVSENDQQKIRDGMAADQAEINAELERSRAMDAPQDQ